MEVKVNITGGIFLNKCIDSVYFKVDTPNDSDARTTELASTLELTGRIGDGESTVGLCEWSLIKPDKNNKDKVFRNVEVEMILAGQGQTGNSIRKVVLPQAFVVDYSESYSKEAGVGTFSIYLKQKKDNNENIEVTENMNSAVAAGIAAGVAAGLGGLTESVGNMDLGKMNEAIQGLDKNQMKNLLDKNQMKNVVEKMDAAVKENLERLDAIKSFNPAEKLDEMKNQAVDKAMDSVQKRITKPIFKGKQGS